MPGLLAAAALAQTTSTFCAPAALPWDTRPTDGESGVPRGVTPLLFFPTQGLSCPPPAVDAVLVDRDGVEVPSHLETLDARAARVVPEAPLAPGYYGLLLSAAGGSGGYGATAGAEVWFRVDESLLSSPGVLAPPDAALRAHCTSTFRGPTLAGDLSIDRPADGLARIRVLVDGVSGPWRSVSLLPADDARALRFSAPVPGGLHEVCVEAQLLDLSGAVAETAAPVCFDGRGCPPPPPSRCATSPLGGLPGASVAWLAARRRRTATPTSRPDDPPRPP